MTDFKNVPEGVSRWENNEPVLVMRPLNRPLTRALTKVVLEHQSQEAARELVTSQPLMFLGFLTNRDGRIVAVDENGENPESVDAGDVLCEPSMLRKPE